MNALFSAFNTAHLRRYIGSGAERNSGVATASVGHHGQETILRTLGIETVYPSPFQGLIEVRLERLRYQDAGQVISTARPGQGRALRRHFAASVFLKMAKLKYRLIHSKRRGAGKFLYKQCHKAENMFAKLKDWRRIAMRFDRCAHACLSAIKIVAIVIFWINQ